MAQQKINYGAAPNDGTGDLYRVAMIKIDNNFTDLYTNKVDNTVTIALSGGATGTATALSGAAVVIPVTGLNMGNATAGTLAVARGGTGVTTSTGTGSVVLSANAALTGNPTATTQAVEDNSTRLATTAHVKLLVNQTFTDVPATNQGPVVYVTTPHFRTFIWDGTKYVRAPWHMPGVLFHSHAPAASVTHGIQVRADVTYSKADYPDLAAILGVSGSTFVLPEGRARVLRAADNGRGIDAALVNGYIQEDAIRNITGLGGVVFAAGFSGASAYNGAAPWLIATGGSLATVYTSFDASRVVPTATENRVKSLSATLYITK